MTLGAQLAEGAREAYNGIGERGKLRARVNTLPGIIVALRGLQRLTEGVCGAGYFHGLSQARWKRLSKNWKKLASANRAGLLTRLEFSAASARGFFYGKSQAEKWYSRIRAHRLLR